MNTAQKYEKIEKTQPASHTGRSRINSGLLRRFATCDPLRSLTRKQNMS